MITDDAKLSEPLLDADDIESLHKSERRYEQISCTRTIRIGSNDSSEHDEDVENDSRWSCTTILRTLFPILLMVQLYVSFRFPQQQSDDSIIENFMSWSTANYMIVLFAATSWVYRRTLANLQIENVALLIFPEIMLTLMMGSLTFGSAAVGFASLLGSLFIMGLFIACANFALVFLHTCTSFA